LSKPAIQWNERLALPKPGWGAAKTERATSRRAAGPDAMDSFEQSKNLRAIEAAATEGPVALRHFARTLEGFSGSNPAGVTEG